MSSTPCPWFEQTVHVQTTGSRQIACIHFNLYLGKEKFFKSFLEFLQGRHNGNIWARHKKWSFPWNISSVNVNSHSQIHIFIFLCSIYRSPHWKLGTLIYWKKAHQKSNKGFKIKAKCKSSKLFLYLINNKTFGTKPLFNQKWSISSQEEKLFFLIFSGWKITS